MKEETSILCLPWEDVVCRQILCYLSLKDLYRLKYVSKSFNGIVILYIDRYCRDFDFTYIGGVISFTSEIFRNITKLKSNMSSLTLKNCKGWLKDEHLLPIIKKNRDLECLSTFECYGLSNDVFSCISGLSCLKILDLSLCRQLSSEALALIGANIHSLQLLNVSGCWNVNDESICVISVNNKNLKCLYVASCYAITDFSITNVAKNCREIKTLDIRGCWRVRDTSIVAVGEYCKFLENLYIKDCSNITEISVARLRPRGVKVDKEMPREFLNSHVVAAMGMPLLQI